MKIFVFFKRDLTNDSDESIHTPVSILKKSALSEKRKRFL